MPASAAAPRCPRMKPRAASRPFDASARITRRLHGSGGVLCLVVVRAPCRCGTALFGPSTSPGTCSRQCRRQVRKFV
eukprot:366130-Chlamydomonas_euryale.AAC.21